MLLRLLLVTFFVTLGVQGFDMPSFDIQTTRDTVSEAIQHLSGQSMQLQSYDSLSTECALKLGEVEATFNYEECLFPEGEMTEEEYLNFCDQDDLGSFSDCGDLFIATLDEVKDACAEDEEILYYVALIEVQYGIICAVNDDNDVCFYYAQDWEFDLEDVTFTDEYFEQLCYESGCYYQYMEMYYGVLELVYEDSDYWIEVVGALQSYMELVCLTDGEQWCFAYNELFADDKNPTGEEFCIPCVELIFNAFEQMGFFNATFDFALMCAEHDNGEYCVDIWFELSEDPDYNVTEVCVTDEVFFDCSADTDAADTCADLMDFYVDEMGCCVSWLEMFLELDGTMTSEELYSFLDSCAPNYSTDECETSLTMYDAYFTLRIGNVQNVDDDFEEAMMSDVTSLLLVDESQVTLSYSEDSAGVTITGTVTGFYSQTSADWAESMMASYVVSETTAVGALVLDDADYLIDEDADVTTETIYEVAAASKASYGIMSMIVALVMAYYF